MILKGKNILITGAGKGIGFAAVEECLREGAYVFALVKSKQDFKKFQKNKNLKIFHGNVKNINLIKKIFKQSLVNKKLISGLVNNAGIRQRIKFNNISKKNLKDVFDVNFFSIFFIMQIFSKYLIQMKSKGSIVNIGSIAGKLGFSELSGYVSTKSALSGLTKSFAAEMTTKRLRANLINPGFIKTSYFNKFKKNKKLYKWTLSRIPMKRWGNPYEISNLISFLLSDKSSYITGETINIDGGWSNS